MLHCNATAFFAVNKTEVTRRGDIPRQAPKIQSSLFAAQFFAITGSPRWAYDEGIVRICEQLTPTETVFPATDLRLIFQVLDSS